MDSVFLAPDSFSHSRQRHVVRYTAHKYTSLMDLIGSSQAMFLKSPRHATSLDLDHFISRSTKTAGRNQVVNVS